MKTLLRSWIVRGLALVMAAAVLASATTSVAVAQDRVKFRQEELDQMLAPIALYPDPLLSQILMASTYPLEVVEAARWSKANPNLKGEDAVRAADSMNWDPSVKSLAAFPQVLDMMDSKLEWTESLGEAFLGQQEDVMNSVQALRRKADAAGNLLSSDQMRVGREGDYITIEPPAPQVVYVPYYNPTVVYGPWWYPAYPPVYWAPPAYYVGPAYRPGFYWGSGIAISATFFFGHTDWRHRRVTVVNNRVNNVTINRTVVNNRTVINNAPARSRVAWQPDPAHRRGAPFHREAARQRFEQHAAAAGVATRSAARPAAHAAPEQRGNAVQEKREARRPERRENPQSRAAPQESRPGVMQGGQRAQPSVQQRDAAKAQAEARRRQATPAPQAAEPRIENRQAPRPPQAQSNAPRPQAESHGQRPAPRRPERQAERHEAPRAQPQSHSPRPAPAPHPEARNNGGGARHQAPAANHPPARSNGNQQRTERGGKGRDG